MNQSDYLRYICFLVFKWSLNVKVIFWWLIDWLTKKKPKCSNFFKPDADSFGTVNLPCFGANTLHLVKLNSIPSARKIILVIVQRKVIKGQAQLTSDVLTLQNQLNHLQSASPSALFHHPFVAFRNPQITLLLLVWHYSHSLTQIFKVNICNRFAFRHFWVAQNASRCLALRPSCQTLNTNAQPSHCFGFCSFTRRIEMQNHFWETSSADKVFFFIIAYIFYWPTKANF